MPHDSGPLASNIFDTALIFEGGGMRATYTAGMVCTLLENDLFFDQVYGVSAGSSHTVNYLSRDIHRAKASFVDLVTDPNYGGLGHLLLGEGWFHSLYCYQQAGLPDGSLPFDFDTFRRNPAHACIIGFQRDSGQSVYWTEEDMPTLDALMRRVRASSSMPFFMPTTNVDGTYYYDGGLGEGAGLLLPKALQDGHERFFIVRTRPRSYRKSPSGNGTRRLMKLGCIKMPRLYDAWESRWARYNAVLDQVEELERQGRALVVYPENMQVNSTEVNFAKLDRAFDDGYDQAQRELERWRGFLFH
ncbi:MAG: patatin family protein [Coriobacteriales bacterium]|jgi:predicted patatin/cPLA2 family phospholipase|nr:patatin family protein [Coriobacteriales bacterium]